MAPDGQSARVGPGRWLVPALGSILGLVALINAFLFAGRRFFASDGDVGRHIRVGRTILDGGVIPNTDLYSHTRHGTRFVPYEWWSEAVTALACNAAAFFGTDIVIDRRATKTIAQLHDLGYRVHPVDTGEFLKSGGSVYCLHNYYPA